MAAAPEPYLPRYRIVADQAGSWDQAALRDTIHAQGYAIIRLGTADTRAIQDAAEAGAAFHDLPTNIKARTTLLVDEAAAGAAGATGDACGEQQDEDAEAIARHAAGVPPLHAAVGEVAVRLWQASLLR